jgi:hypothetical protein
MIKDIPSEDLCSLLICSFRYALGRSTYISFEISELVKKYHHLLSDHEKTQIIKDIESASLHKRIGQACDKLVWLDLAEFLK